MINNTESLSTINVYDFDKTIYRGDSMVDFYVYSVIRQPLLLRFLPAQLWHIILFYLGQEDRTTVKTNFFRYLKGVNDPVKSAERFWESRATKLADWYLAKDHDQDVILTASPEFLIKPIAQKIGVHKLIATKMNPTTGKIIGLNCYGEEKIRRLKSECPNDQIHEAYGDRESDIPVLRLAKNAYLVKGEKVTRLKI